MSPHVSLHDCVASMAIKATAMKAKKATKAMAMKDMKAMKASEMKGVKAMKAGSDSEGDRSEPFKKKAGCGAGSSPRAAKEDVASGAKR